MGESSLHRIRDGFEVAKSAGTDDTPVYRLFNPYEKGAGAHLFTTDAGEYARLPRIGWQPEEIGWWGL